MSNTTIKYIQLKSKIFETQSKLSIKPDNITLQLKLKKYKSRFDKINKNKCPSKSISNKKTNTETQKNTQPVDVTSLMLCKPWNKLNNQVKEDRLYTFCEQRDMNSSDKKKLYSILKKELHARVLTKKNTVEYNDVDGFITDIVNLPTYLKQLTV